MFWKNACNAKPDIRGLTSKDRSDSFAVVYSRNVGPAVGVRLGSACQPRSGPSDMGLARS